MKDDLKAEAAILQLEALGFIEVSKDQEGIRLTEKGRERAKQLVDRFSTDDSLLVAMYCFEGLKKAGYEDYREEAT